MAGMLRSALISGLVLAIFVGLLAAVPAHAQSSAPASANSLQETISRSLGHPAAPDADAMLAEIDGKIARWEKSLEVFRLIGGRTDLSQDQLSVIRNQILATRAEIDEQRQRLADQASEFQAQLESLGPPPDDGLEPDAVLRRRGELTERVRAFEGRGKEIGLLAEQADQQVERIGVARVAELRERLFTQYPVPVMPAVLLSAVRDALDLLGQIISAPIIDLSRDVERTVAAMPPLIAVTAIALALWAACLYWLERRYGPHGQPDSFSRRVLAAVVVVISRGVAPAAVIAVPIYVVQDMAFMSGMAAIVVTAAQEALVRYLLLTGMIRAALAPNNSPWRLPAIPDPSAAIVWRRSLILLATLHVAFFLISVAQNLNVSPELRSGFALVFSVLIATNLLALLRRAYWEPQSQASVGEEESDDIRGAIDLGTVIRWMLILVAVSCVAFALVGYSEAAIWLLSKLIDVCFLALAVIMARGLLRDLTGIIDDPGTRAHLWVKRIAGATDTGITRTLFWFNILIDLVTFLVTMIGIALILGMSIGDLYLIVLRTLDGFDVGSVRISPGSLLAGLIAFFVALVITRMIQRGLVRRIFPHTHIDTGVQHSVTAGIGYIGITLALLTAVAVVGFDLSNLALIAGALSVGIGFGLQAIVNNFVSGLILLAERPLKVGDWIRIGEFEGTVKRINVRATEIQTFQRSEVIIPNSELISSALINYTHKDKYGRIDVAVPVSYGSDPKEVGDILLAIAAEHPMIAKWPEPYLYFHAFDEVAMRMQLRVYLTDINNFLIVTNDLHFAVAERFRAAGIPFARPHTETRLRRDDVQDRMMGPAPSDPMDHHAPKGGEMES